MPMTREEVDNAKYLADLLIPGDESERLALADVRAVMRLADARDETAVAPSGSADEFGNAGR